MPNLTPGQLIRQARQAAGLPRERLAVMADTSVSTVVRLELYDRMPNLAILTTICDIVGVPIEDVAAALKAKEPAA
jgi:DNA-binding XRE family transcriptional regulator